MNILQINLHEQILIIFICINKKALYAHNVTNGHGKNAALDDKTRHARFPHPDPLPVGEGANESVREFHVK